MKKLLITGASGMLGSAFVAEAERTYDVYGTCLNHCNPALKNEIRIDLRDSAGVAAIVSKVDPDCVVHCAALTNIDICEEDYEAAYAANAMATGNLVSALKPGKRFIYISTDAVFDGMDGNYSERDLPSPLNNYAKTKLEGEQFVGRHSDNYVIVRTNIFGWNHIRKGGSFAEWVYDSLYNQRPIKMFTDVIFTPLTVYTLSRLIMRLLVNDFVGILNIGSGKAISKYDFGVCCAGLSGFNSECITPVSVDTFSFKAKRSKNMSLNVSLAKTLFGNMPGVEDEIRLFFEERSVAK